MTGTMSNWIAYTFHDGSLTEGVFEYESLTLYQAIEEMMAEMQPGEYGFVVDASTEVIRVEVSRKYAVKYLPD